MTEMQCPTCDITFSFPDDALNQHKTHGTRFYCPNGHKLKYNYTELDRIKEHLVSARDDMRYYQERARILLGRLENETRRRSGCQGMIKRLQNEVKRLRRGE